MKSMTYGTLPTREEFDAAFEEKCPSGLFAFGNDPRVGTCKLNCSGLWDELNEAILGDFDSQNPKLVEESGDWASLVLYSLGFEWI